MQPLSTATSAPLEQHREQQEPLLPIAGASVSGADTAVLSTRLWTTGTLGSTSTRCQKDQTGCRQERDPRSRSKGSFRLPRREGRLDRAAGECTSAYVSGIYPQFLFPELPIKLGDEEVVQGWLTPGAQVAWSTSLALTHLILRRSLYVYPSEG